MASTEGATQCVESVGFSLYTKEEVRKLSVIQITNPNLLDDLGNCQPRGLYDPAMGPLNEKARCGTCGQLSKNCPGHCGHIELIVPVYNPLLFNMLYNLLQRVCHFCFHFRASRTEVERCVSQLKFIIKGDITGAKTLESSYGSSNPEDSDGSHVSCSSVHSGAETGGCGHEKQQLWTSLQHREAMSILNDFLKKKVVKCQNCGAKNPKISKPTFGWLRTSMPEAHNRENVIRGVYHSDSEGALSEAGDIGDSTMEDGIDAVESHTHASRSKDTAKNKYRKGEDAPAVFSRQKDETLVPKLVKETMKRLWENEDILCSFITDIQQQGVGKKADSSIYFLETILVPSTIFRPPAKGGDSVMEHHHTKQLNKVLQSNISLGNALENKSGRLESRWLDLQQAVNIFYDSKTATGQGQKEKTWGVYQFLEKKEGMFRQKMMGKRVNFSCRSVISPDPYLAVNEIGIPPYFATTLTYPERVTPWNVAKMRNAIVNGPENISGATHYDDKISVKKLPKDRKSLISIAKKLPSSRGAVSQHGRFGDSEFEGKVVLRHIQDGDIVLVNRQPSLHKPSIMAHVVRVLKGEKTIRMHYANCSTYNADFDGDEMNVHFPQDEISRAEAYNIVNANNQFVVPSHGQPIRALIQDHIISAVLLTMKDTFLDREHFHQLLYSSGVSTMRPALLSGRRVRKVLISFSEDEMQTVPPAILKPEPLWTGKQVITAVLNIITRGRQPFTVGNETKLAKDFFKTKNHGHRDGEEEDSKVESKTKDIKGAKQGLPSENRFLVYKNELINGVLDKAQFGMYGMVHMVQELYGASAAGILLSAMSRLFTAFLQTHGFTCGMADLMMMRNSEEKRERDLKHCEKSGEKSHFEFLGIREGEIDCNVLPTKIEEAVRAYGESALTGLDMKVVSALRTSQEPMQGLLSHGLLKPSVKNCFSLMTTSGAKGSKSNFQQVCSYLGQQELEGKRVPRMVSGKTLPCFSAWDIAPRSGGYIADRFLSGLRPQEYYFHCMAGREGLVDTAVKTSRSGYLQRCLIKNLECLKVGYDHTVRDVDGSIVQFRYGEDGVDVHQSSFIEQFELLASNHEVIDEKRCPLKDTNQYIKKLPAGLVKKAKEFIKKNGKMPKEAFLSLMMHKYMSSLVQPGEPVGVIAAQSVGEPSTQMTLNTFHHAGRGEMNVTLGIPRLQEILMRASSDIKTPIMTCPLLEGRTEEDAKCLAAKLRKITLADIMESIEVSVVPFAVQDGETCTIYKLKIKLYAPDRFPDYSDISLKDCEEIFENVYVRELEDAIQNYLSTLSKISGIKNFTQVAQSKTYDEQEGDISESGTRGGNEDDDDNDKNGEEADDLGVDDEKQRQEANDEVDYEDESDVEEHEAGSESHSGLDENDKCNAGDDADDEVVSEMHLDSCLPLETSGEIDHSGSQNKRKAKRVKKEFDRAIHVAAKGLNFEVHFKFTNEPHILLTQIAQRTSEKVSIRNPGKINNCRLVTCESKNQVVYFGGDLKERKELSDREKEKFPALKTAGVDFSAFWKMQDDIDVRYIYSNNIQEVLNVYGVEAARETIVREVNHVFKSYSVSVNRRHLTLIADYMTFSGTYRPMNRLGGISESTSPFCKISFETAGKFIVEAACHGQKDILESPSSRICLGLPVKVGTGCFDIMQQVQT